MPLPSALCPLPSPAVAMPSACVRYVLCFAVAACGCTATAQSLQDYAFQDNVRPILQQHCYACHGADDEVEGELDLTALADQKAIEKAFETWQRVVELVDAGAMPPDGQQRLTEQQKLQLRQWYQQRFVDSVEAHPGFFRPRRLSAHEYRNSLQSLLGFPLQVAVAQAEQTVAEDSLVMKLLPTDPPGPSGFTNDTSGNPLTTAIWDQYSYLVDNGLQKLFSPVHREQLEAYTGKIEGPWMTSEQATTLLRRFARRAFRREVSDDALAPSLATLNGKRGADLQAALQVEMKAILMSPMFLYRGLGMNIPTDVVHRVDDFELAERLSYFLWADLPDDELLELASEGRLHEQAVYEAQIDRLLAAPKARNLADDFCAQWFSLNEIDQVSNNPPVADALKSQPIDFLYYLFTADRPLAELIDSEVTFINAHTAKFYPQSRRQLQASPRQRGIEVQALPNQRVSLQETADRGGLLTMPGVLAMNRGPVLRGTWLLERVLGERLPEPPADVGQVPGNQRGENLTFRERFEQHRREPTCAVCHDKIDPLGFSLQAYGNDGGVLKSRQQGGRGAGQSLDTSGRLLSGESFEDFDGLKQILMTTQRERVIRQIVKQTMAFALARKLEVYDQPEVERIVKQLNENAGTFRGLVHQVANSLPFRETVKRNE